MAYNHDLNGRGIDPPIDVLPSLSRQMQAAIGDEQRALAAQLYATYAEGRDLRQLVAIIGEASLSEADRRVLEFADRFERLLVGQGGERRTMEESMAAAWGLLKPFPPESLKRIPRDLLKRLA